MDHARRRRGARRVFCVRLQGGCSSGSGCGHASLPVATDIGETLHFGGRDWTVVGVLDSGKSGYDSELWGYADQLMQAFRRPVYSSVIFKLSETQRLEAVRQRLEGDRRLTVEAKRETVYYADQSQMLANFIKYLGLTLSIMFSIGAVIGAMITMYASCDGSSLRQKSAKYV